MLTNWGLFLKYSFCSEFIISPIYKDFRTEWKEINVFKDSDSCEQWPHQKVSFSLICRQLEREDGWVFFVSRFTVDRKGPTSRQGDPDWNHKLQPPSVMTGLPVSRQTAARNLKNWHNTSDTFLWKKRRKETSLQRISKVYGKLTGGSPRNGVPSVL